MDLSVSINNTILNVRVSLILKTPKGLILEKDKAGFHCTPGGRIQTNETSVEAIIREVKEEMNIDISEVNYRATIENFFEHNGQKYHEFNIIHEAFLNIFTKLPDEFIEVSMDEVKDMDIRPKVIHDLIKRKEIKHVIQKND